MTKQEREAYKRGYNDGLYGFSYINLNYSEQELKAWSEGYKQAKNIYQKG